LKKVHVEWDKTFLDSLHGFPTVDTGAKGHEGEDAFSYPHLRTHGSITTLQLWVAWIFKRVGSKVRTVSMATKKKRSVYSPAKILKGLVIHGCFVD